MTLVTRFTFTLADLLYIEFALEKRVQAHDPPWLQTLAEDKKLTIEKYQQGEIATLAKTKAALNKTRRTVGLEERP